MTGAETAMATLSEADQDVGQDDRVVVAETDHQAMANAIRFLAADAVQAAKSGHPGMPMGMADVATVLFSRHLKFDAADPEWADRDRFVLSAGHGSMLLYSLLYLTGYPGMDIEQIRHFRQLGYVTAGHPEHGHAPGIETTTGPLGQGLATAVGMALAERLMNARYGDETVDHHTYVIAGDGCLMEGVSHEAISLAGHLRLSKLIVLFDDNAISIDGGTELSVGDDQQARFKASGWNVASVDGHDPDAVSAAIEAAKSSGKPSLIACKTVIGRGAPNKQGTASTHGAPLGDDEIAAARDAMDWPHEPFEIPEDVLAAWRALGRRGRNARSAWQTRIDAMDAGVRSQFQSALAGEVPEAAFAALDEHKESVVAEAPKWATRQASGKALAAISPVMENLLGGSADLTGSVNTKTPDMEPVTPDDFSGRYMHYGVREHGMAAAMNGIALHGGFVPYGGTFLVFTDYMKGAMRLSALMKQRVVYVLTHDSIGLGEDGPTHQAVETLASLRALPNFNVFRPCDAVETAECWSVALRNNETPSGMVLTRQGVPTLRTVAGTDNLSARGAYVLIDAEGGNRDVTFLATGSEVSVAMDARAELAEQGIAAAVVSMPCWELFERQDDAYRAAVLGDAPRVAVEAAVQLGWDRYIGTDGAFVGMTGFGASAPAPDLFEHFGITPTAVADRAKRLLGR